MSRSAIVERPIDATSLLAEVSGADHGAVALFVGTVRDTNDGRPVEGIDYTAYTAMAEPELERILDEAEILFGVTSLVVEHRIGALAIGDASVGVAASHAHRQPALDSVRYVIDEIKKRVPIWKMERYSDGTRDWVDPASTHAEART
jgi:molybdopterin synthase catalytic subunit